MIKCKDVCKHIEELCPRELAIEWDNVGLLVGDPEQEVRKVLVALDATPEVINEAIHDKADMIVTHHPLFNPKFGGPIKNITTDSITGKAIYSLIKNNIAIYCAHTNLDIAQGGINDVLVDLFQLKNVNLLETTDTGKLKKLVVFVPQSHLENVRSAISKAGAGWTGNYSDCTFQCQGEGTFKGLEGANPYIGSVGELEKVQEHRLETIFTEEIQTGVINAMLEAHPYEEVAYDIYPLENKGKQVGLGRVGELPNEIELFDFAKIVKQKLKLDNIRIVGDIKTKVKKVAICSGSGMSLLKHVKDCRADVYITGDVKYHDAQEALAWGINIIDAGHYQSENIIVPVLKKYIEKIDGVEVLESRIDGNPFKII